MKITLIEPQPPGLHFFSEIKLPRLGLTLLGAVLARLGHDVRIFVEDLAPVNMTRVLESDLVGFST
ncbi:MAG TPA: B12-binding domain-containing radical SAM protein, partial [Desulfotomaculum sp.]|nr:B12-binding domain-containing radical SAM protein [Desulfotomaculum sp.]